MWRGGEFDNTRLQSNVTQSCPSAWLETLLRTLEPKCRVLRSRTQKSVKRNSAEAQKAAVTEIMYKSRSTRRARFYTFLTQADADGAAFTVSVHLQDGGPSAPAAT